MKEGYYKMNAIEFARLRSLTNLYFSAKSEVKGFLRGGRVVRPFLRKKRKKRQEKEKSFKKAAIAGVGLASLAGGGAFLALKGRGKIKAASNSIRKEAGDIVSKNKSKFTGSDVSLVVPANRLDKEMAERLKRGDQLSIAEVAELTSNSVYFLAGKAKDEFDIKPNIRTPDRKLDLPEGADMLIRFNISDGKGLVGRDLKRSLTRELKKSKEKPTLREYGILNDFDSLQSFNRA